MRTILLTKGMEALVSEEDFDWLNQWSWYAHLAKGRFYAARRSRDSNGKKTTIFMQDEIGNRMGLIGCKLDHKDRNRLNNQRGNLRVASHSQNMANSGTRQNNSGYRGVSWSLRQQKWAAQICFQKRTTSLGYFDCPIKAAQAYDRAAKRLFGEFASLNFPD